MISRDPRPDTPPAPPIEDPASQTPVIDDPGRLVPAVDPRRPGAPRPVREPHEDSDRNRNREER